MVTADRDHAVAEVGKLEQERKNLELERSEAAGREMRAWFDELVKFPTPEEKVAVLDAVMRTSPHENVREWARLQIVELKSKMDELVRKAAQAGADVSAVASAQADSPGSTASPPSKSPPRPPVASLDQARIERIKRAAVLTNDAESCVHVRAGAPAVLQPSLVGTRRADFDDPMQIRMAQSECERAHPPGQKTWNVALGEVRWACECTN